MSKQPAPSPSDDQVGRYAEKIRVLKARRIWWNQTKWGAFVDWMAVAVAVWCFVFLVLWAASPDSQGITLQMAMARALSYSVPVTFGMWGITRATRKGSHVPPGIAETLPYARLGKDGKLESSTTADDKNGTPPTPLNQGGANEKESNDDN